jgi:hypothetical protein
MGTVRSGSTEGLAPYRSALDHVPCVPLACPKFARSAQPILLSSVAFKSRSSMLLGKRKARRTTSGPKGKGGPKAAPHLAAQGNAFNRSPIAKHIAARYEEETFFRASIPPWIS